MKGEEFIKKIRRLGIERGVPVHFDNIRGKGSHGRLYYGDRYTTVKDRKEELGRGLLAAMLKQLGLIHKDIAG